MTFIKDTLIVAAILGTVLVGAGIAAVELLYPYV